MTSSLPGARGDSAAWLAAIVESSNDAIVSKTVEGVIRSWNPGAERLFGYRAEEATGQPITMLFPPDRLHEEAEFMRRIKRGERIDGYETIRLRKDGTPVPVSVTLAPIANPGGAIVGVAKIARDITKQREAERQLRAEELLLRITLSSIGDAVATTDGEGGVTFLNPEAERLTGWTTTDAVGRALDHIVVLVNEQTEMAVENPVTRALREGVVVGLANHTVLIARDGTRRPIDDSAAPIRDEAGQSFGAVLVFRDITERRRRERDLQLLAAIVASSDDAIVSKTLDGTITAWSPGAERIFGGHGRRSWGGTSDWSSRPIAGRKRMRCWTASAGASASNRSRSFVSGKMDGRSTSSSACRPCAMRRARSSGPPRSRAISVSGGAPKKRARSC